MTRKYLVAVSLSDTTCKTVGVITAKTIPDVSPPIRAVMYNLSPYSFAFGNFPAPNSLPTSIPPPEPIPSEKQATIFFTTVATEFAATASLPKCPKITEYAVKPNPQTISLQRIGDTYFQKFLLKETLQRISFFNFNFTRFLFIVAIHQKVSIIFDVTVAMAAPATPNFGKLNKPKIKIAFNIIFIITLVEPMMLVRTAFPVFFNTHK